MATVTANMGLSIPAVNDSDYPTSITDSFNALDDHDHSPGAGVQIPTGGIAASAVTTPKIADGNVTEAKIATNAVTATKIADGSVQTAKIADGNVTEGKLAANSVTTTKIADGNVTEGKLAANSVTTTKIADGSVQTAKIADANVTPSKLSGVNFNQSGGCGTISLTTTGVITVVSTSITSNGRNLLIMLEPDGDVECRLAFYLGSTQPVTLRGQLRIFLDATQLGVLEIGGGTTTALGESSQVAYPVSSVMAIARNVAAGAHTVTLQANITGTGCTLFMENFRIAVTEIF